MSLKKSWKTLFKGAFVLVFLFAFNTANAGLSFGYKPNTVLSKPISILRIQEDTLKDNGPRKATLLSAIFPGAGQIYNKKYWKLPVIYGGLGVLAYLIRENSQQADKYAKAYEYSTDGDSTTDPASLDAGFAFLSSEAFRRDRDEYRDLRDLSILVTAGVYILQIVDANVDAHLREFDVGDDLSMSLRPKVNYNPFTRSINNGFSLGISIKNHRNTSAYLRQTKSW